MQTLKTLVEQTTKTRFRAMAKARGCFESELLRVVILTVTGQGEDGEQLAHPDPENAEVDRMTVRMPRFLLEAAQQRARTKGMAPSRYVAALVQSHMTQSPVMSEVEILALQASGRELAAIGRNVNQMAHALNAAFHETERVRLDVLAQLQSAVLDNRAAIRSLVRASQNAWAVQ